MWMVVYLLVIIIILLWLFSSPFYWKTKKIPYLVPLPIFGSCLPLLIYGLHDYMIQLYQKFPGEKYFGIHFLTRPTLFIKDPELIQRIFLKDFDYFTSHGIYGNQDRDPGGGNLFLIYGQQWKEIRQKLTPFFTPAKIKTIIPYLNNTFIKTFQMIDKNLENNNVFDVAKLFHYFSVDSTVQIVFGIESDTFENEKSMFREMASKSLTPSFFLRIITGLISPTLYNLFKFKVFEVEINNTIKAIVKDSIELRKKENIVYNDLLQGMIGLLNTKSSSENKYFPDKTRVPKYDLQTITSQLIVLYEGSVETTAEILTFLFYELALHPEIQETCREEINSIIPEGTEINAEHINKLLYLNATVKETLRMYSPFIMLNRECTKTYKVPDSDLIIDKGTFIITSPVATHLQEEHFPEPNQFRPERFLNENKAGKKPGTVYFPFGEGPRTCIGMNYGLLSIKYSATRLLQHYQFSTCSKTQIPMKYAKFMFLTMPSNGLHLNVKKILV